MNRPWTPTSKDDAGGRSTKRSRVRAYRRRLERELARDLAVLVESGLIEPVGPLAGASDETLRFGLSESSEMIVARAATPRTGNEDHGSSGMETIR